MSLSGNRAAASRIIAESTFDRCLRASILAHIHGATLSMHSTSVFGDHRVGQVARSPSLTTGSTTAFGSETSGAVVGVSGDDGSLDSELSFVDQCNGQLTPSLVLKTTTIAMMIAMMPASSGHRLGRWVGVVGVVITFPLFPEPEGSGFGDLPLLGPPSYEVPFWRSY